MDLLFRVFVVWFCWLFGAVMGLFAWLTVLIVCGFVVGFVMDVFD